MRLSAESYPVHDGFLSLAQGVSPFPILIIIILHRQASRSSGPPPQPSIPVSLIPHGKVEHKARSLLDPALYSERYIKQEVSNKPGMWHPPFWAL